MLSQQPFSTSASPIAARRFDASDQTKFAELCGDHNPMHMDPVSARRTQAGAPVVHGIHAILWSLDTLIACGRITKPIAQLHVQFKKFIYVGSEVTLRLIRRNEAALQAELCADGLTTTTLKISFTSSNEQAHAPYSTTLLPTSSTPLELDMKDLHQRSGLLASPDSARIAQAFPHADEHLGASRVGAIAQLSTLVGMVCPGLHSIFSAFSLDIVAETHASPGLSFQVGNIDERFRMAEINVCGAGILGTVTAFIRRPPIAQPGIADLRNLVSQNEFTGTTALIVGGSRGLGALSAKAIAAGGGRVVITYAVGEAEAREIAREIGPEACRVLRYDAREDASEQLRGLDWEINQLYYFATTHIFRQKAEGFAPARFAEFCNIYVNGFEAACSALRARGSTDLAAFYPSSIALDERPRDMTEYCMAKAAGEVLCADLHRFTRGLRIVAKRLPRLLTDQTATVMPVESSDPLDVMLPIIREMHVLTSAQMYSFL